MIDLNSDETNLTTSAKLSQAIDGKKSSDRGMKHLHGIEIDETSSSMRNNSDSLPASQIDKTADCAMNNKKRERFGLFRNLRRRFRSFNRRSDEIEKEVEDHDAAKVKSQSVRQKHSGKCKINLCSKPSNSNSSQSTESLDMNMHLHRKLEDSYWSNKDRKDGSFKKDKASCRSKDISKFQTDNFVTCSCESSRSGAGISECQNCQKISNVSPHRQSSHIEITVLCHGNGLNPTPNPTVHHLDCNSAMSESAISKEAPKAWSLTHELFRLSKFGWYWGPITRREAERKLNGQPDGAFLVRDSSDERYLLSLSFRSYGRTLHTRIEHCNGKFIFDAQPDTEGYPSIVDLIENSMNDPQTGICSYSRCGSPSPPIYPVRLTKPVSRFTQVRSLQYMCRFVIRQYTRYDHIQMLPLPKKLKGWIGENQY